MDKFDLSKDVLDQFTEKEITPGEKKATKKKNISKNQKKKIKKKKKAYNKKKKNNKNNKKKLKEKMVVKKQKSVKKAFPEDYPQNYIEYGEKSLKTWKQYKENFYIGEELKYKMKYLGVTSGYLTLKTNTMKEITGKEVFHFSAHLKTANYYSFIYWLDDYLHSYLLRDRFLPLKHTLVQREKKQKVDDLQLFDHEKNRTFFLYKKIKKNKTVNKKKTPYIPTLFQDSFSGLYFLRGLPMYRGMKYYFPIVTRGKVWILNAFVDRKENIEVMGKKFEAYKILAETKFPGALEAKGAMTLWFSTNADRKLLKFKAKVKIGALEGNLVEAKDGKKVKAL